MPTNTQQHLIVFSSQSCFRSYKTESYLQSQAHTHNT